jgi:ketosteroid isomerase-like protein
MSEENVGVARHVTDAWNQREIDRLSALIHPEAEYINPPTAVAPGTRRGIGEVRGVIRAQWDWLTDAGQEIDRIYDRGEEVIRLGLGVSSNAR